MQWEAEETAVSQESDPMTGWDCDRPNGPDMEPNSMSILLDWWAIEVNYAAYKGGKNHGGKQKVAIGWTIMCFIK